MAKIILTADKTLMSEYNKHVFLGFAACAPSFLPTWLYQMVFLPPADVVDGRLKYAHCGQRKIEAALLGNGFSEEDVAVVPPGMLGKAITGETKVVGITTHDPLGLGPASTTFSQLGGRETFTSIFFRELIQTPEIREHGVKVIVGGAGAWQVTDERIMAKLGIDSVVIGEGEITAVELMKKAVAGEKLPMVVQGQVVPLGDIPQIRKPTLNGLIEIARGCGRGCKFCNPTMTNYRCFPLDYILQEARLNVEAGAGIIFHAEDVLRYKAKGFTPNEKEVVNLFTEGRKLSSSIGISHFAHASVVAKPTLVEQLSEIMEVGSPNVPFISGEVGLETGSPRIVEEQMRGKVKPFVPQAWPDVIRESHQILADNKWIPAETLIIGLPGEEPRDVQMTIDLIHDIDEYKSLIVPLFFVPLGNLQGKGFYSIKDAIPEHWQLLAACIQHDFRWVRPIAVENLRSMKMSPFKRWAIFRVINYMDRKLAPYLKLMAEGTNPLTGLARE
jgi:radical SAM superfamily enzyme YgiQ (UPF0313 family)